MKREIQLATQRLTLRPMTESEMRALAQAQTDAHMENAYREMLDGCTARPEAYAWFAAWRIALKDGTPVGDLCFKGPPQNGAVEIGYGIEPPHQRSGYATEAVGAAVRWAMKQKGVWVVTAETEPGNEASQHVLKKCGFKPTGRRGKEGPLFETEKRELPMSTLGLCGGMIAGMIAGLCVDEMGTWMPVGLCVGLALGSAADAQRKRKREAAARARAKSLQNRGEKKA